MKKIMVTLVLLITSYLATCQTIELQKTIIDLNHNYLSAIEANSNSIKIQNLETLVVNYDTKELSKLFDDEKDMYNVTFKTTNGIIVASYNKQGKIVKTIERYSNVRLPLEVMQTISNQYPNWGIVKDVYLVKYHYNTDELKKEYKIKLKNNDNVITVKTDANGSFI